VKGNKRLYNILFWLYLLATIILLCQCGNIHSRADSEAQADIIPQVVQVVAEPIETVTEPKYAQQDIELICKVVYAEARGECDEGQRAIVQVILNRVYSPLWDNTISEVIRHEGQFCIADTFTEKEINNTQIALECGVNIPADYMYFGTWRFRQGEYIKIGNHYFMR